MHIGVGNDGDLVIAGLERIEVVLADAGADGRNHVPDFFVAQHFVVAGLLHVQDLALQRQDGLIAAVAAGPWGGARGPAPPPEKLPTPPVLFPAIRERFREASAIQRASWGVV